MKECEEACVAWSSSMSIEGVLGRRKSGLSERRRRILGRAPEEVVRLIPEEGGRGRVTEVARIVFERQTGVLQRALTADAVELRLFAGVRLGLTRCGVEGGRRRGEGTGEENVTWR